MDVERALEQGWDAVRDPSKVKVIYSSGEHRRFVQFDPQDTLVFPVDKLSSDQRRRVLEARPDLSDHIK